MQEVKQACQPTTKGGGFADLLQAVLSQEDACLAPRLQEKTAHPLQPQEPTPKPRALGDVTNTQAQKFASGRQSSAGKATTVAAASKTCSAAAVGKACIAAPVAVAPNKAASRSMSKPPASFAAHADAARTETKAGSRRSARVQARKKESKPDGRPQSGASQAVELFSGAHQVKCSMAQLS